MTVSAQLRTLVVLYWLVGTLDVVASLWLKTELPPDLLAWQQLQAAAHTGIGEWLLQIWMIILLLALIVGSLGIFRLYRWGRWGFALANLAMFASYPLLDAMVYTWFGGLFADVAMLLTGAILWGAFSRAGTGLLQSAETDSIRRNG
ncbi:MAG: hypothetical protein ACR2QB_04885 [Gammaproteobacteria bacterium]